MTSLPKPQILRCVFDETVSPRLPAMLLHWDDETPGLNEGSWHLPGGVMVKGAAPGRFGITVHRLDDDRFRVRLVWNEMSLQWDSLNRRQIVASSLGPILQSLGTDLWMLLDQPIAKAA